MGGDPANISGSIGSVSGYARPNLISDPWAPGPVNANSDVRCHTTISQGGWAADAIHTAQTWFNPCAFDIPKGYGNFGRNSLRSSNVVNVDFSVFRKFKFGESKELQFRAEAFNVFNFANLGVPSVTTIGQTGAGSITSIIGNPRQIQFGLRFVF